jgi:methylglutaconyl-CoA hydratase
MTFERILAETRSGIGLITLNRPDKRNALDALTVRELRNAVIQADNDSEVRVVVLKANGPDFCAGVDLDQLQRIAAGSSAMENLADAQAFGDLFITMRRAAKPIIAAVHGNAIAGGAGLATAADLIVASADATFGYPEIHLGFVPAIVLAMLRRNVGEKVAFELAATGRRFGAEEAARLGLVSRVFQADRFAEEAASFANELASRSSSALTLIKRMHYGSEGLSFEDAIARGAEINALARATPDCREGVRRFLERSR